MVDGSADDMSGARGACLPQDHLHHHGPRHHLHHYPICMLGVCSQPGRAETRLDGIVRGQFVRSR
eukprot:3977779-Pleurochrysis_carterae.AAC.1